MVIKNSTVNFARVSSADQRDGFSLGAQHILAKQYAKKNGLKIVKSWSVDESASKELDRKHFFAMIDYVKKNDIKEVVFDKIDRACRGLQSAVKIEDLIESGVRFHFTRDNLIVDRDSEPSEKLRFYLGVVLGKYYIDNLKSEINKGLRQRSDQGFWNSKAPVGYRNFRNPETRRSEVIIDEEIGPVVVDIFEKYATGNYGFDRLAKILTDAVPDKTYSKRVIEGLVSNPFYFGRLIVKGKDLGLGVHKPLIEKKLWDQCQKIRGIRSSQSFRKQTISNKPLMGLMSCGKCGHAITGETKNTKGRNYIYYHCANRKCPERRRNTSQDKLMTLILSAFEPFKKMTPKATDSFLQTMESRLFDLDLYNQKEMGLLAEKRLLLKRKINDALGLHRQGKLSEGEYHQVLELRRRHLDDIELEMNAHLKADRQTFEKGRWVIETFIKLHDYMLLDSDPLEKIELVKLVLSKLTLTGGTLEFHFQKPFDVLIETLGVPYQCSPTSKFKDKYSQPLVPHRIKEIASLSIK